jgi:hypothetical protein
MNTHEILDKLRKCMGQMSTQQTSLAASTEAA